MWVSTPVFDGAHWDEVEQSGEQGTIQHLFETMHNDGAGNLEGTDRLVNIDGKATLYDGRTGEAYDSPVTVGYVYILKLSPPRRRQDPRPVDRPVLDDHAAAAGWEGAVRWPALR